MMMPDLNKIKVLMITALLLGLAAVYSQNFTSTSNIEASYATFIK